ncbi:MAG: response regulator [Myxococcota bacterium]
MPIESPSLPMVRSVLIIDDHEADVAWCRLHLRRSGRYGRVTAVSSAKKALELFDDPEAARRADPEGFPPDVVFLDINLPGLDGFAFLRELEARRGALVADGALPGAVVMLSSSDDERDVQRATSAPLVEDYVVKPLSLRDAQRIADRFGTVAA